MYIPGEHREIPLEIDQRTIFISERQHITCNPKLSKRDNSRIDIEMHNLSSTPERVYAYFFSD